MASEGTQGSGSSGKRPMYVDLDAPVEERPPPIHSSVASGSSEPSSGSRKKKKTPNEHWPPIEYTEQCRAMRLQFYERRSFDMLKREYLNGNRDGYRKLTKDLHNEFVKKLDQSEKFNNFSDFWLHSDWLDKNVIALTTNILEMWHYQTKKKSSDPTLNDQEREFLSKLAMMEKWCQKYSKNRNKKAPWQETSENQIVSECESASVSWLSPKVKVIPMPGHEMEGAYGSVKQVRLTKIQATIPSFMMFARKTLKVKNERDKRRDIMVEAMACPVNHPGIIRLTYLRPKLLEGYSLWWNGGSLLSFLSRLNSKVRESTNVDDIVKELGTRLSKEELEHVATYRKNRVNLALLLLVIVGECHEVNFIHNDISTSNVLLHFDPWKKDTVYIGICDWGLSSTISEQEPSKYGFQDQKKMDETRSKRKFVAPELFYLFENKPGETSLESMQKKHLYSKASDAYAAGWIAERIWNEEWDSHYFPKSNPKRFKLLHLKLKSLQKENVQERASVLDVLDTLKKAPYCWEMPTCCFRK